MDRRNDEWYLDLTAWEAFSNMDRAERMKGPVVFICSPYAGDVEYNVMKAKYYTRFAVSKKVIPITPHLMYPQVLSEDFPKHRKLGLDMGTVLLARSDELWVFGNTISSGMLAEIHLAEQWEMPISRFDRHCRPMKFK